MNTPSVRISSSFNDAPAKYSCRRIMNHALCHFINTVTLRGIGLVLQIGRKHQGCPVTQPVIVCPSSFYRCSQKESKARSRVHSNSFLHSTIQHLSGAPFLPPLFTLFLYCVVVTFSVTYLKCAAKMCNSIKLCSARWLYLDILV